MKRTEGVKCLMHNKGEEEKDRHDHQRSEFQDRNISKRRGGKEENGQRG